MWKASQTSRSTAIVALLPASKHLQARDQQPIFLPVWPPLQLASELRHVLPEMAVRGPIMADTKEKMKIDIKKFEPFIPWVWGGVLVTIIVLFVKNALAH